MAHTHFCLQCFLKYLPPTTRPPAQERKASGRKVVYTGSPHTVHCSQLIKVGASSHQDFPLLWGHEKVTVPLKGFPVMGTGWT